ncbi:hypothetical protein [Zobellella denitrificans]|uniref:hypothetical protein n=1 Tax=Zobellella denitrificans TaxID=347534 RepID=UPI0012FD544F|nr:hypothetical protein [Zobellella denitrificans]
MFDIIEQSNLRCVSILTKIKVSDYLEFVDKVYSDNGGIAGQRAPLKTKTAITIRSRMVSDISKGAVLPPVVIGIHTTKEEWEGFKGLRSNEELLELVGEPHLGRVSIIDGMQRTTAIIDAKNENESVLNESIRVEYWVSDSLNNLIYRMLVLNTGQVPWEVSRQLKTVYSPLLKLIEDKVGNDITIFNNDIEPRRRTKAGQYQGENLIQLLLSFSSRKYEVDLKDKVAEDFARLDLIESSSHEMFLGYFVETISMMTSLDKAFSNYIYQSVNGELPTRYKSGSEIFKSFPAQIGFCVALAIHVFDEPGFDIDWTSAVSKFESCKERLNELIRKLEDMTHEELGVFLDLDVLDELMNVKKSQVGRFERRFFTEAFSVLIEKTEKIQKMTPCWRKA